MKRALSSIAISLLAILLVAGIATAEVLSVVVDIKPQSCPNPMNVKSKGVLPVAVLGTCDFDVAEIDVATIALEGVPPLRTALRDVATPFNGSFELDCFDCTEYGPDGLMDLGMLFRTQDIVAALDSYSDRDCLELVLTAELLDGTPIEGSDAIIILDKGRPPR